MASKRFVIGILAIVLLFTMAGTGAFAQNDHKHEQFDVLIGINYGFGISPNVFGLLKSLSRGDDIPRGNYAFIMDLGVTADFYIFYWLSVNAGVFFHPDFYVLLDHNLSGSFEFTDIAYTPLCLTIPISVHVNIPKVEWLYMGAGLTLNIPLFGILEISGYSYDPGYNTKGDFFYGLPVDLGFDFIKSGRGGMRLFFRITPEFHKKRTALPIGLIWQIWNFKIFSK